MQGSIKKLAGDPTLAVTFVPKTDHEITFCRLMSNVLNGGGGTITVRTSDGEAASWRPGCPVDIDTPQAGSATGGE